MASIEELLHRRSDLSTFLVHLTRDGTQSARDNLVCMLRERMIEARTPMGMAVDLEPYLRGTRASQRVVCFTETPLEHTWMMVEQISGRTQCFSCFGLVFTKTTARRKSCNPVWYVDMTPAPGHQWLTKPIDALRDRALEASKHHATGIVRRTALENEPILKLTPFIEQMGPTRRARKEFWWEREWRHVGDFCFEPRHLVAILAAEDAHEALAPELGGLGRRVPVLDPRWGQERMIAALSGIDPSQIGPFPRDVSS
jgi:hypothetical protein